MKTRKIAVHYDVEVSEKVFQRVLQYATELGYDFADAGPIETVRRALISEGRDSVFSESTTEPGEITFIHHV